MTPLPAALGGKDLVAWRLDRAVYAESWNSGEGAFRAGGRWNSKGVPVVYCSLDPSTAILEVAVHKGFEVLDRVPHIMTSMTIGDPSLVHVVNEGDIPNAEWLRPVSPGPAQQTFGNELLAKHPFIVIPSAVSPRSWNLIFNVGMTDAYVLRQQETFSLDTRLNPSR